MTDYFSAVQTGEIEHNDQSFVQAKAGYIIPANVKVKIIPSITSSVEVAGLILPKAKTQLMELEMGETFLVDTDNGNLLGATEGCLRSFGIPYSLCYGNTVRSPALNITQIFPKINSINDIKEMRNDALLGILDTSMVPSIFNFEWDAETMARHRQIGKFASHWTKARVTYLGKESNAKNKLDIMVVEIMKATRMERLASNMERSNSNIASQTFNVDVTPVNNHVASAHEFFVPEVRSTNIKKNLDRSHMFSHRNSLNKTRSSRGSRDRSQTEEEIQAMIAQQEKIRRLREKRAMIDAPATSSEIFMFKLSIYLMILLVASLLFMNTIVCHQIASLIQRNTESVVYLSDRQVLVPVLARQYRTFDLLLSGLMTPTAETNLDLLKVNVVKNLEALKQADSMSEDPMLFLISQGVAVNNTFEDYNMMSTTNQIESVPMYLQQAIYNFISNCETLVDTPDFPSASQLEAEWRSFYFVKQSYPIKLRSIFDRQQTEYELSFYTIASDQMQTWLWMIVGAFAAIIVFSVTLFYSLWRIARSLNNISNVLSSIRISDIIRQIAQLQEFEKQLKEHKEGNVHRNDTDDELYTEPMEEVQILVPESTFNAIPALDANQITFKQKTNILMTRTNKPMTGVEQPKKQRLERKKTVKMESIDSTQRSLERNLGTTARIISRKLKITGKKESKAQLLRGKTSSLNKRSKSSRSHYEVSAQSMSADKSSRDRGNDKDKTMIEDTRVQFEESKSNENFLSLLGWLTIVCFILAWPLIVGALVHTNEIYKHLLPLHSDVFTVHSVRSSVVYLNSFILDEVAEGSKQTANSNLSLPDLVDDQIESVYSNLDDWKSDNQEGLPLYFASYETLVSETLFGDLCASPFKSKFQDFIGNLT